MHSPPRRCLQNHHFCCRNCASNATAAAITLPPPSCSILCCHRHNHAPANHHHNHAPSTADAAMTHSPTTLQSRSRRRHHPSHSRWLPLSPPEPHSPGCCLRNSCPSVVTVFPASSPLSFVTDHVRCQSPRQRRMLLSSLLHTISVCVEPSCDPSADEFVSPRPSAW